MPWPVKISLGQMESNETHSGTKQYLKKNPFLFVIFTNTGATCFKCK